MPWWPSGDDNVAYVPDMLERRDRDLYPTASPSDWFRPASPLMGFGGNTVDPQPAADYGVAAPDIAVWRPFEMPSVGEFHVSQSRPSPLMDFGGNNMVDPQPAGDYGVAAPDIAVWRPFEMPSVGEFHVSQARPSPLMDFGGNNMVDPQPAADNVVCVPDMLERRDRDIFRSSPPSDWLRPASPLMDFDGNHARSRVGRRKRRDCARHARAAGTATSSAPPRPATGSGRPRR